MALSHFTKVRAAYTAYAAGSATMLTSRANVSSEHAIHFNFHSILKEPWQRSGTFELSKPPTYLGPRKQAGVYRLLPRRWQFWHGAQMSISVYGFTRKTDEHGTMWCACDHGKEAIRMAPLRQRGEPRFTAQGALRKRVPQDLRKIRTAWVVNQCTASMWGSPNKGVWILV